MWWLEVTFFEHCIDCCQSCNFCKSYLLHFLDYVFSRCITKEWIFVEITDHTRIYKNKFCKIYHFFWNMKYIQQFSNIFLCNKTKNLVNSKYDPIWSVTQQSKKNVPCKCTSTLAVGDTQISGLPGCYTHTKMLIKGTTFLKII